MPTSQPMFESGRNIATPAGDLDSLLNRLSNRLRPASRTSARRLAPDYQPERGRRVHDPRRTHVPFKDSPHERKGLPFVPVVFSSGTIGQHRDKKNKKPLSSSAALSFASRCRGDRCDCFPSRCRWRFFRSSLTDLPFACTGPIAINSLCTAKARNESKPAGGVSPPSTATTSGPTRKMANGCGCSTPETKDRGSFMENFDANLTRRAAGVSPPVLFCFVFCSVPTGSAL